MIHAMIVEDDPMVAEINKRCLQRDARIHTVKICSHGGQAMRYLEGHAVDLLLLDVYMPHLNGFDFLRRIRSRMIDTDVILVTAANNHDDLEKAIRFGVLDYLIKPFEYERFRLAVDRFFLKHEMLKQNKSPLSQQDVDRLMSFQPACNAPAQSVEKGIHPQTLELIQAFLQEHGEEKKSGGEIAKQIGLSRVTVQKYLNFMKRNGQLDSEIDYRTDGRPRTCYCLRPS